MITSHRHSMAEPELKLHFAASLPSLPTASPSSSVPNPGFCLAEVRMVGGKGCSVRNFWGSHSGKEGGAQLVENFPILFWHHRVINDNDRKVCRLSGRIIPHSKIPFSRSTTIITGGTAILPDVSLWQPQSECWASSSPFIIHIQATKCSL